MSQYQAGTLVVYGNLGVHEIEAVGPQSFCGEPAREYYTLRPYFSDSHDRSYIPTAKEGVLRPVSTPEQAAACLEQVRRTGRGPGVCQPDRAGGALSGRDPHQ